MAKRNLSAGDDEQDDHDNTKKYKSEDVFDNDTQNALYHADTTDDLITLDPEEGEVESLTQEDTEDGELPPTAPLSQSSIPIYVPSDILNKVLDSVLVVQDKLDIVILDNKALAKKLNMV